MTLRDVFINRWGRLRSGWRVTIFVMAYIALQIFLGLFILAVYSALAYAKLPVHEGGYIANVVLRFNILGAALLAGYLCTRLLEGLPWQSLGLTFHRNWVTHFLVGSAVGALSLALATAVATASGGLRFSFAGANLMNLVLKGLISAVPLFIIAALAEEALFRGYPLQTLSRAHLAWVGVLLTSLPFAAVHLANPNVAAGFTFLNTALAGVWLAAAYLKTRSLWFPLGVHWSWNWTMDWFFGIPVSGLKISSHSVFTSTDLGPAWLTGGSYGIEGGISCTIAILLSTLFIWRMKWISATTEMLEMTSHENPRAAQNVISILPGGATDKANPATEP